MLVREVMTSPAITVPAGTPLKDGLKLLDRHHVTALPVVSPEGQLLGIVSEADLLKDLVKHDQRTHLMPHEDTPCEPAARYVEDVMSTLSMTVSPDNDLCDAVDLMTGTAVKSLPVVDSGHVVGVVSRSDVVHLLARSDELIRAEIDELLRSAEMHYTVDVNDGYVVLEGSHDTHHKKVAKVIAGAVQGVMSVDFR